MKTMAILSLVVLCVIGGAVDSSARTLELEATQVAVIKPAADSDDLRFLVQFDLPRFLEGRSVDFGCISFGADCAGENGAVSFQAFVVTRAWDQEIVSWSDSWDTPGGDWDSSSSAYCINEAGDGQTIKLDVTDFVNAWLKDSSKNFGVIIKVSGPFFGTFSVPGGAPPTLTLLY